MYQYDGKEKEDELDLGWMDYGARMYMPEIGRWGVSDPKAESYESEGTFLFVFLWITAAEGGIRCSQSVMRTSGSVGAARNTRVPLDFGLFFKPKSFAKSRGAENV
jgi:hypothetical protein